VPAVGQALDQRERERTRLVGAETDLADGAALDVEREGIALAVAEEGA